MKRCVALKAKNKILIELNVFVFQTYVLVKFGDFRFFFHFAHV